MREVKLKRRHKKYPCLRELTKKEEKELLQMIEAIKKRRMAAARIV